MNSERCKFKCFSHFCVTIATSGNLLHEVRHQKKKEEEEKLLVLGCDVCVLMVRLDFPLVVTQQRRPACPIKCALSLIIGCVKRGRAQTQMNT